jgi:hypothetical protein
MNGVCHQYSTNGKVAHVGGLLTPKAKRPHEVYRIQYYPKLGEVAVSDMLDEGHFLQPTVESVKATDTTYKRIIARLVKKYEALLQKL